MNVLYLSYDGMTDPLGQSQVLPYLAGLTKAGHGFTLVSFEKRDRYEKLRAEIQSFCNANNIDWQPLMYTKRPPVLSTVWDVSKMQRKAAALHEQKKFDLVHCRSYIAALVGLRLKRRFHLKFVFDMRGFWADERVEGKLWNLSNPLFKTVYNFFKKKEKSFLEEANRTISLTHNAKHEIEAWPNIRHQGIDVIPCCADMTLFDPAAIDKSEKQKLRGELGIGENDFVLSYIGSLGTWYMLDEMLDFFAALVKQRPDSKFLVVTNDPQTNLVTKATALDIPLEKIIVTQSPRNKMPLHISLSDATLFFIRPTFSKKASSPVKQGEAMGMGVPIVCNAGVGDTDEIVLQANGGIVIQEFSRAAYNTAVEQLLQTRFDRSRIRAHAIDVYGLQNGIDKYEAVYNALAQR